METLNLPNFQCNWECFPFLRKSKARSHTQRPSPNYCNQDPRLAIQLLVKCSTSEPIPAFQQINNRVICLFQVQHCLHLSNHRINRSQNSRYLETEDLCLFYHQLQCLWPIYSQLQQRIRQLKLQTHVDIVSWNIFIFILISIYYKFQIN